MATKWSMEIQMKSTLARRSDQGGYLFYEIVFLRRKFVTDGVSYRLTALSGNVRSLVDRLGLY